MSELRFENKSIEIFSQWVNRFISSLYILIYTINLRFYILNIRINQYSEWNVSFEVDIFIKEIRNFVDNILIFQAILKLQERFDFKILILKLNEKGKKYNSTIQEMVWFSDYQTLCSYLNQTYMFEMSLNYVSSIFIYYI